MSHHPGANTKSRAHREERLKEEGFSLHALAERLTCGLSQNEAFRAFVCYDDCKGAESNLPGDRPVIHKKRQAHNVRILDPMRPTSSQYHLPACPSCEYVLDLTLSLPHWNNVLRQNPPTSVVKGVTRLGGGSGKRVSVQEDDQRAEDSGYNQLGVIADLFYYDNAAPKNTAVDSQWHENDSRHSDDNKSPDWIPGTEGTNSMAAAFGRSTPDQSPGDSRRSDYPATGSEIFRKSSISPRSGSLVHHHHHLGRTVPASIAQRADSNRNAERRLSDDHAANELRRMELEKYREKKAQFAHADPKLKYKQAVDEVHHVNPKMKEQVLAR